MSHIFRGKGLFHEGHEYCKCRDLERGYSILFYIGKFLY